MTPIYLPPNATVLIAGMKRQPPEWIKEFGWSIFTPDGCISGRGINKGLPCEMAFKLPYRPGQVCYVPEVWCLYQTLNMRHIHDGRAFDEISDGMYGYKADGFDTIQDFKDHIRLISDSSFLDIFVKDDKWQSPALMPSRAARRFVRILTVEPMQVKDVGEEDAIKAGVLLLSDPSGEANWSIGFTKACLQKWWHLKHPGKEWAWTVRVENTGREG